MRRKISNLFEKRFDKKLLILATLGGYVITFKSIAAGDTTTRRSRISLSTKRKISPGISPISPDRVGFH